MLSLLEIIAVSFHLYIFSQRRILIVFWNVTTSFLSSSSSDAVAFKKSSCFGFGSGSFFPSPSQDRDAGGQPQRRCGHGRWQRCRRRKEEKEQVRGDDDLKNHLAADYVRKIQEYYSRNSIPVTYSSKKPQKNLQTNSLTILCLRIALNIISFSIALSALPSGYRGAQSTAATASSRSTARTRRSSRKLGERSPFWEV